MEKWMREKEEKSELIRCLRWLSYFILLFYLFIYLFLDISNIMLLSYVTVEWVDEVTSGLDRAFG